MTAAAKKTACTLACFAVLFILIISGRAYGTEETAAVYPDENGRFYLFDSQTDSFSVKCISGSGERVTEAHESVYAQELIFSDNEVYAVCIFDGSAAVFDPFAAGDQMLIADGVSPKRGCVALCGGRLYITDSRDDGVIRIYDDVTEGFESITAGGSVNALFVYDGRLYALLDDGVLSVDSGEKTLCPVPSVPFVGNGGIYCDSGGRVFGFSGEKGFEELCRTGYAGTVYCHGALYALDGKSLLSFGMDGKQTGIHKALPEGAQLLSSSGERLAVYCGGELIIIDKGDFDPVDEQQSVGGEEPSQSSTAIISGLSSGRYEISGGYIFGVEEGTTIAALKRELVYSGELVFKDYKGKTVTAGRTGTGTELQHYPDGSLGGSYTIVITGDLTGEGNINTSDLRAMAKHLTGEKQLGEAARYAGDVNGDGLIDIRDLCILHRSYYS